MQPPAGRNLADYVLGRFTKDEQEIMIPIVRDSVSAIETVIKDDLDLAMNRYNIK